MQKVFLDANIFFAAAGSPQGGSAFVLKLAKHKKISVITVSHALLEAERNIKAKLQPDCLELHYENLVDIGLVLQSIDHITREEIARFEQLVPLKDVPILYGAVASNAEDLITLDKKHFTGNEKLFELELPFKIWSPGDFLRQFSLPN